MKLKLTILSAFVFPLMLMGQSPFTGSEGDGYAMASVELSPSLVTDAASFVEVYPSILQYGAWINLPAGINAKQLYLTTVNGRSEVLEFTPGSPAVRITATEPGMYILRLVTLEDRSYYTKLILLGN